MTLTIVNHSGTRVLEEDHRNGDFHLKRILFASQVTASSDDVGTIRVVFDKNLRGGFTISRTTSIQHVEFHE